eukprot:gene4553-4598_t
MISVQAFELLATTVLLLNEAGEVVEANSASEDMFGRRGSDTIEVAVTSLALVNQPWAALIEIRDVEQRLC